MKDMDLWAIVMDRFPKWEKERTCRMERTMRNAARESYYKRLMEEKKQKEENPKDICLAITQHTLKVLHEREAAKAILGDMGTAKADSSEEVPG